MKVELLEPKLPVSNETRTTQTNSAPALYAQYKPQTRANKETTTPPHNPSHPLPCASPQEDLPPLPEVAAAAAADKGAWCHASCLLPAGRLLRLLPMLPMPAGTLPTKACVLSTASKSDSNSKLPALAMLEPAGAADDVGSIRRILLWGNADAAGLWGGGKEWHEDNEKASEEVYKLCARVVVAWWLNWGQEEASSKEKKHSAN